METLGCLVRQRYAALWTLVVLFACTTARAQPNYAIYLDAYPRGNFQLVEIPDLDARKIKTVQPRQMDLDLPRKERRRFQVANGDVYVDGSYRRIVFGGRVGNNGDWDIYEAEVNVNSGSLDHIQPLISNRNVREEDPRLSWDGLQVVYKCNGMICLYPYYSEPVAARAGCELWAPAIDFSGSVIAYVERCNDDPESDRIVRYSISDDERTVVPNVGGRPDRFPHFTLSGEIVYSHIDSDTGRASLWLYDYQSRSTDLLHDETESDDDPYVFKQDERYVGFIGWAQDNYDLYVYRDDSREAVQLTQGTNVLGPILIP